MSYGALSKNAVLALNAGAQIGGFAQAAGVKGELAHIILNQVEILFGKLELAILDAEI
ncbi:MAG: hypothetical protein U0T83_07115 [Bacteriovoracaceae bacterium]